MKKDNANITLNINYTTYGNVNVTLPDGYTEDNISSIFIKWARGTITFDDQTWFEFDAENDEWETDFKYPDSIDWELTDNPIQNLKSHE